MRSTRQTWVCVCVWDVVVLTVDLQKLEEFRMADLFTTIIAEVECKKLNYIHSGFYYILEVPL